MLELQKLKSSIISIVDLKYAPLQCSTWHFWPAVPKSNMTLPTQQQSLMILRCVPQLPNNKTGVEFKTSPHPHGVGVLEC